MFRFGLKLWSTNIHYVEEALRLYKEGVYHYIELYVVPGSFEEFIHFWKNIDIPFIIHAPHFRGGMNLAKRENEKKNLALIKETQQFVDELKAEKVIIHPGIDGDIRETVRQLKIIQDKRILIENKPYHALDDGLICNGTVPDEIRFVMNETGVGFCLDIGHAICAANGHNVDPYDFLRQYFALNPYMFHLTDGDFKGVLDRHDHIGEGQYDIRFILSLLCRNATITIETSKSSSKDLNDFVRDIEILRSYKNAQVNESYSR